MRSGPRPISSSIKRTKGNPGKRKLPNEPDPAVPNRLPPAPKYLGDIAKKEWKKLGKELMSLGLFTNVDLVALSAYCSAYELWVESLESMKEMGPVITTTNGNLIQNPHLSIANKQLSLMKSFMAEFGMTPSSRTGMKVSSKKEKDKKKFGEFIKLATSKK